MTRRLGSPSALAAGYAVLLTANAIILGAAGWNRWGGPRAEMALTERELALPLFRDKDDTGVLLSLVLGDRPPPVVSAVRGPERRTTSPFEHRWLDRDKLRALGFDVDLDPADPAAKEHYERTLPRRVFVALELDGDAWKRWLAAEEERVGKLPAGAGKDSADAKRLELDRITRSRLIPVDAAVDAESLERRYPDRGSYAVLAAVMSPELRERKGQPPTLGGRVTELLVQDVQVPTALRPVLERFLPSVTEEEFFMRDREQPALEWLVPVPPRYRVVLAFGRRHEPWLLSVTPIEDAPER